VYHFTPNLCWCNSTDIQVLQWLAGKLVDMRVHVHDVAHCSNTIRTVALVSDWLATPGLIDQRILNNLKPYPETENPKPRVHNMQSLIKLMQVCTIM